MANNTNKPKVANATKRPNVNKPPDLDTHKIHVTFFKDAYAKTFDDDKDRTLPELRDLILQTKGMSKGELPWLKLAYFGQKTDPDKTSGCLRWDGNVTAISGIELDYDKEILSFDEIVSTLKAMKVRALAYTSPSNTEAAPRMRVLLPVSQKLAPDTRKKLCARVNGRFGNIFAPESFTLSQSYYYGMAKDNPAPNHRAEIIDGRMIDLCVDDFTRFENNGYTDASPEELVKHAEADAAKAEERARRLEKVAEIARSRAKHTPRK